MVQSLISELNHIKSRVHQAQDYTVKAKDRISRIIDGVATRLQQGYSHTQGHIGGKMSMLIGGTSFGTKSGFAMKFGGVTRSQILSKVEQLKTSVRSHPKLDNNMKQWVVGKLHEIQAE
jgi:hypothetical protein